MAIRRFNTPDLTDAVEQHVGPYQVALVYRHISNDEGPTVHVFGLVEGEHKEILRFDCFKKQPHFHLGISYLDDLVAMIQTTGSLSWVLQELNENFPAYLLRSRANNELPDDWAALMGIAVDKFRSKATEW